MPNDIDNFCAACAERGVEAALRAFRPAAGLGDLAMACRAAAVSADLLGRRDEADRLYRAMQYLRYLENPLD